MTQVRARVVNRKTEPFDVFIGRGSLWGNPFRIGEDGDRQEVIRKYQVWIGKQDYILSRLPELKSKVLGCYCSPLPCHGDVLVKLLEGM